MSTAGPVQGNNEEEDEIEKLQDIRFVSGGKYEGTWNAITMEGVGRYVTFDC